MSAAASPNASNSTTRGTLAAFPVALKLDAKRCLLIGSASETAMRATQLLDAGARLTIVSESPDLELSQLATREGITLQTRPWQAEDLEDCWLVVLTDQRPEVAAAVGKRCASSRTFFCAIDQPEHSSFSHVAIARAGIIWAAIGTSGAAPALASRLRMELQRLFDESNLSEIAARFALLREQTERAERRTVLLRAAARVKLEGRIVES